MKSLIALMFIFVFITGAAASQMPRPTSPPPVRRGTTVSPDGTVTASPGESVIIEQRDVVDDAGGTLNRTDKAAAKGTDVKA